MSDFLQMKEEGSETHLLIHMAGVKLLENKINYSMRENTKKTCFSTVLRINLSLSLEMMGKIILRDSDHVSTMQVNERNIYLQFENRYQLIFLSVIHIFSK